MIKDDLYQCLNCNHLPLDRRPDSYRCSQCGTSYRVMFGVPLFLKNVQVTPSDCLISPEIAQQICSSVSIKPKKTTIDSLQQIFSYSYQLDDFSLAAENNYFFNRIPLPEHLKRPPAKVGAGHLPVNQEIKYAVVGHLIPEALPAGRTMTKNVRILNRGQSIISSQGSRATFLTYEWRSTVGELLDWPAERSVLPIDLLPGRAITLPTTIATPPWPGSYMLELHMTQQGTGRLPEGSLTVGVDVVQGSLGPPANWTEVDKPIETYNYQDDHKLGQAMLAREFTRRRRSGMRVLEVGGCCSPQAGILDADLYSVDIDVQTLQVGQLALQVNPSRLQYVCADVNALPFGDDCFDTIVIFSSLHHFPDPLAVLLKLKRLLKRDGFLAIMCEPVGCYLNGQVSPQFVNELEHGINEQIFTREEYHHLFLKAGLYSYFVEIDRGSFKAFLEKEPKNQRRMPVPKEKLTLGRIWRGIKRRLRRSA